MSKIALKSNPLGTGTFTIESPDSNNDRTVVLPDGNGSVVLTDATQTLTNKTISGANNTVNNLNASNLSSGTVPAARLGSGTADSTTFLRGDNTWQTISTTPTTDQVLTATAGASVGAVGTYAFLGYNTNANVTVGTTYAGSGFSYAAFFRNGSNWTGTADSAAGTGAAQHQNVNPSGTWRCMGSGRGNVSGQGGAFPATLFLRVS
jgi:hypothetical protein